MAGYDLTVTQIGSVYHTKTSAWARPKLICRHTNGLVYFEEGSISYDFGDSVMTAGPGDVLIFPKGLCYSGERLTGSQQFIVIDFETAEAEGLDTLALPRIMHAGENVGRLFRSCSDSWNGGMNTPLICRGILYAILGELTALQTQGSRQSVFIEEVLCYISDHYTDPSLDVAELSETFHISASQLRRLFVHSLGLPPSQYIIKLRLELAQNLLRHERLSVRDAALRSGFSSEFYFSRLFRERIGLPPSRFRSE